MFILILNISFLILLMYLFKIRYNNKGSFLTIINKIKYNLFLIIYER